MFERVEENDDQTPSSKVTTLVLFSFNLVFFIATTELIIRWNHVQDVNNISGTGQIIPVVVAGAGLVRVLWKITVNDMKLALGEWLISYVGKDFVDSPVCSTF